MGDEVGGGVGGFHDETQVDLVVVAYGGEDTHVVAVVVVAYVTLIPGLGIEPSTSLQWKHAVLITGSPGKSLARPF